MPAGLHAARPYFGFVMSGISLRSAGILPASNPGIELIIGAGGPPVLCVCKPALGLCLLWTGLAPRTRLYSKYILIVLMFGVLASWWLPLTTDD